MKVFLGIVIIAYFLAVVFGIYAQQAKNRRWGPWLILYGTGVVLAAGVAAWLEWLPVFFLMSVPLGMMGVCHCLLVRKQWHWLKHLWLPLGLGYILAPFLYWWDSFSPRMLVFAGIIPAQVAWIWIGRKRRGNWRHAARAIVCTVFLGPLAAVPVRDLHVLDYYQSYGISELSSSVLFEVGLRSLPAFLSVAAISTLFSLGLAWHRKEASMSRGHAVMVAVLLLIALLGANWYIAGGVDVGDHNIKPWLLQYAARSRPGSANRILPEGDRPIHKAVAYKRVDTVRTLLTLGADPNVHDLSDGKTALHIASWWGNEKIVAMLLESGANPEIRDKKGRVAFHGAALAGSVPIMDMLREAGASPERAANDGALPLHRAARGGNLDAIAYLLDIASDLKARDKQGRTAMDYVCGIEPRMYAPNKLPPIAEAIELLAKRGFDVNDKCGTEGDPPLHIAVRAENAIAVRALLKQGADPNGRGYRKRTPIHRVMNDTECLKALIDGGADVNAVDDQGFSKLFRANDEQMQMLLDAGADPNVKSNYGQTALHLQLSASAAEILLKGGADPNITADNGETAIDAIGGRVREEDVVAMVRKYGGKTAIELASTKKKNGNQLGGEK